MECCDCCVSYRNKTVERLVNTRGTLFLINFNNRWTAFCLLDFFSNARFKMRALFFSGQTPAKKERLRRRSPLHRIHMQIQVRFCLTQIRQIKSQRIDGGIRGGGCGGGGTSSGDLQDKLEGYSIWYSSPSPNFQVLPLQPPLLFPAVVYLLRLGTVATHPLLAGKSTVTLR